MINSRIKPIDAAESFSQVSSNLPYFKDTFDFYEKNQNPLRYRVTHLVIAIKVTCVALTAIVCRALDVFTRLREILATLWDSDNKAKKLQFHALRLFFFDPKDALCDTVVAIIRIFSSVIGVLSPYACLIGWDIALNLEHGNEEINNYYLTMPYKNFFSSKGYPAAALLYLGESTCKKIDKEAMDKLVNSEVVTLVQNTKEIPGVSNLNDDMRKNILETWKELRTKGHIEKSGTETHREICVGLKAVLEQVFINLQGRKNIFALTAYIQNNKISPDLSTAENIGLNQSNESLVHKSTTVLRKLLRNGGIINAYHPFGSIEKSSVERQKEYTALLNQFKNKIFDKTLTCNEIPSDLLGTFYVFKTVAGNKFNFGVKISESNNPQDQKAFELWFGPKDHLSTRSRWKNINDFLLKYLLKK